MTQYIISHDLGTSGDKAALFTVDGEFIKSIVAAYDTYHPKMNQAEQNPEDWWSAVCTSTKSLTANLDKSQIAGIVCTGTMMGCLCLDRDGDPLMNSIIWQDGRSEKECEKLGGRIGKKRIKDISGTPLSPTFSISKIMWVKENLPDIYKKTEHCMQTKDFINYRMTGRYVTDPSDADFYQCYDISTKDWSNEILQASEIKKCIFPEIIGSSDVVGTLCSKAAENMGLISGIPVVTGAGDGVASSLGMGLFDKGTEMISIGSSGGVSLVTSMPEKDLEYGIPIGEHVTKGQYVIGGAMQTAGASLQWTKDNIAAGQSYDQIYEMAAGSPAGANGVFFMPYLQGERTPFWDINLRGSFVNISFENNKGDLIRSVLEGVALHLGYTHQLLQEYGTAKRVLVNGRGAGSDLWCGILSDVLGMEVYRYPDIGIETSLGAAMLASKGLGYVKEYRDFTSKLGECSVVYPNMGNHKLYVEKMKEFVKFYKALEPVYDSIN